MKKEFNKIFPLTANVCIQGTSVKIIKKTRMQQNLGVV